MHYLRQIAYHFCSASLKPLRGPPNESSGNACQNSVLERFRTLAFRGAAQTPFHTNDPAKLTDF